MTDYTELKPLLYACRAENCDGPREFRKAVEALFDVCTVETISALIADNERLRARWENPDPILIQCMDSAIAEHEQLERDAERYQWLREGRSGDIEVVEWIGPHAPGMTGEDLDALLDAAMGKGERS